MTAAISAALRNGVKSTAASSECVAQAVRTTAQTTETPVMTSDAMRTSRRLLT